MSDPIVPPYDVKAENQKVKDLAAAADSMVTDKAHNPPKEDPRFVIVPVGKIPYTAYGVHYSGCKAIQFVAGDDEPERVYRSASERMNRYFELNMGLLLVDCFVSADGEAITAIITRTLDDDQLEIVSERAHIIETMVQEKREAKAKALAEAEKTVETEEKRLRELAAHGEHCLKNHGAITKQLREKKHGRIKE